MKVLVVLNSRESEWEYRGKAKKILAVGADAVLFPLLDKFQQMVVESRFAGTEYRVAALAGDGESGYSIVFCKGEYAARAIPIGSVQHGRLDPEARYLLLLESDGIVYATTSFGTRNRHYVGTLRESPHLARRVSELLRPYPRVARVCDMSSTAGLDLSDLTPRPGIQVLASHCLARDPRLRLRTLEPEDCVLIQI